MRSVDEINALARTLHGSDSAATAYTFRSLAEHVDEVKALRDAGDNHWKAETLDIIIHGLTLLRRDGVDDKEYEALMQKRLARFKEKIFAANAKNGE
jgi:alanine racemase